MIRLTMVGLMGFSATHALAQASFQVLGTTSGWRISANGISADGTVVVGTGVRTQFNEAIRWTAATGVVSLTPTAAADAQAASTDGSVITGYFEVNNHGFRWDSAGIVDINGPLVLSIVRGISGDGSVIVGDSGPGGPFRWTQATGAILLRDLPGGITDSDVGGISADGQVIVGHAVFATGDEAFRWTAQTGMVALGHLTPTSTFARARAVSADGSVIVGFDERANGVWEPFRWTQVTGMVGLGFLSSGTSGIATAVSADGSVVVGYNNVACNERHAFRWTAASGMQRIRDLLVAQGVHGLNGWQLNEATGISADGTVIIGAAYNPLGQGEGWIATLPATTLPAPPACYANCDQCGWSLTANDFQCFLNKYAAHDPYANCDGSTGTPLLTANDFQCFLNKFAEGCPQ